MTEKQKWDYILNLDEKLLQGGVMLSEWTTFLVKDAEIAFCTGAYLSSILSSQAAIESHLRYEYFDPAKTKGWTFYKLIEQSQLDRGLKASLHDLRRYRNRWVHVNDPTDDSDLLGRPGYFENELAKVAKITLKTMLRTLYYNQFI